MAKLKKPFLFALCLLPVGLAAGFFVALYQLRLYPEETLAEMIAPYGSSSVILAISAVQSAGYALVCGFFGRLLAEKLGLWKPVFFEKKRVLVTLATGAAGGLLLCLDHWTFGSMMEEIRAANEAALSAAGFLGSVLYGGIMEELMLRLFLMSLVAFVLRKLFCRKYDKEHIPTWVFMLANVIAAALFAAGHLPATQMLFGELTPLLLFRCFLFNGGLGLVFGWLYRKYGIAYAMAGHALCHIISKLIFVIFL